MLHYYLSQQLWINTFIINTVILLLVFLHLVSIASYPKTDSFIIIKKSGSEVEIYEVQHTHHDTRSDDGIAGTSITAKCAIRCSIRIFIFNIIIVMSTKNVENIYILAGPVEILQLTYYFPLNIVVFANFYYRN